MVLITLIGHLQVSPGWDLPTNFFQQVACGSHCRIFYEQLTPIQEIVDGWKKANESLHVINSQKFSLIYSMIAIKISYI
tara:strand:- start:639 stop:875 length:237 start_codon:yes stop_codon:yes gene_type:complete